MKLSEFQNLSYQQLNKMSVDQLKKLVSEQGQKLNKRVSRIRYSSQTNKTAVNEVMESGGKFGVRGLTVRKSNGDINVRATKQNLIREAKREQAFQKSPTGTFRGAKKVQRDSVNKVTGKSLSQMSKDEARKWRDEQKEKMGKRAWDKMTKKEKSQFYRESQKMGKQAVQDEYDKRIGDAWETFHRWKEEHPAQAFAYPKEKVKTFVSEYTESGDAKLEDYLSIAKQEEEQEKKNQSKDVLTKVDEDNPFDVKDVPPQYKLRNGRVV